ncbi:DUF2946 family protein [Tepidicella baoligensis]|uniref:DUF2946 family protein n=1 Tax=Tepidicella baoligensis TaxID=2707016 RepID=UPI0015DB55E0|nr:DUF2946 family protein [Tepidicella baoligensis]
MRLTKRHQRITTWFAMWLLLLGALMPLGSQALVQLQGGGDWVQVCTSTGMVWVNPNQDSGDDASVAPDTEASGLYCFWCLASPFGKALPPAQSAPGLVRAHFAGTLPPLRAPPFTDSIWAVSQPRAPPLHD